MTKNDFKETIETFAIAFICTAFVMSVNKKCSNAMQKATGTKIEKIQKVKNQTIETQKVR